MMMSNINRNGSEQKKETLTVLVAATAADENEVKVASGELIAPTMPASQWMAGVV